MAHPRLLNRPLAHYLRPVVTCALQQQAYHLLWCQLLPETRCSLVDVPQREAYQVFPLLRSQLDLIIRRTLIDAHQLEAYQGLLGQIRLEEAYQFLLRQLDPVRRLQQQRCF